MGKLLWKPSEERVKNTNMYRFMNFINERFNQRFNEYEPLYQWSIANMPEFWESFWEFSGIKSSRKYDEVISDISKMPGAKWFSGAYLNFAENLLRCKDKSIALIFQGESGESVKITYAQLYKEVGQLSFSLRKMGIKPGDRVVGFMPNIPETVIAMLAATSIGAIWSACSPDFGIKGVLDRFGQIKPRVLFTADGYFFKGRKFDSLDRIKSIIGELPSIEKVVVVPFIEKSPAIYSVPDSILYDNFKSEEWHGEIDFEQLPFEHPLYIMYTSGTTGLPKCMVQSAGGILINQLKELILHTDLKKEDTIFYFTTCGWMMWNWLVSSLAVGASVVLFEGNPFYENAGALWRMAQDEKITIFGTSAGYINALQNEDLKVGKIYNLSNLKAILSTGSPLSIENFEYVYREIKSDIQLASISGGSDINGCFAAGNPMGPVYAGELQCRCLGMKVEAYGDEGKPVINQQGDLICAAPSPSMPIYFWDDPDYKKYIAAYFDVFPNVWRHGDFIEINERGGVVIYGRSDATLNPGGVRIGTAEIYRHVESIEEIQDSIVVGQKYKNDIRVILFVKMAKGAELTEEIKNKIRKALRENASPRHVPVKIIAVPEIPYTLNMKKVELTVKKIIEGEEVLNKDALKNPESLDYFRNIIELSE